MTTGEQRQMMNIDWHLGKILWYSTTLLYYQNKVCPMQKTCSFSIGALVNNAALQPGMQPVQVHIGRQLWRATFMWPLHCTVTTCWQVWSIKFKKHTSFRTDHWTGVVACGDITPLRTHLWEWVIVKIGGTDGAYVWRSRTLWLGL